MFCMYGGMHDCYVIYYGKVVVVVMADPGIDFLICTQVKS